MKNLWMLLLGCLLVAVMSGDSVVAQDLSDLPSSPFADQLPMTEADFDQAKTYTDSDRIVGTYYFYWYDVESGEHFFWPDGRDYLTDHPYDEAGYSYNNPEWHRREMEDILAAGIDFITPVYWGCPACSRTAWSFKGLPPLVQACDEMVSDGITPPRIGLFYDTSTLGGGNDLGETIDLKTDFGREWFYASIRDFFVNIPPRYWAMVDGKPIVILYSGVPSYDQSCIDYVYKRFAEDFAGRRPYIVRERAWRVDTDNLYAWGAAVQGFEPFGVMSVGPGYDHRAVVPPRTPLVVYREGGAFYERNWITALRYPSNILMIETWNELHEGTDICATKEYGRQYIDLTAKYTKLFHENKQVEMPPGPFTGAEQVSVELGKVDQSKGLKCIQGPDGANEPAEIGGKTCRKLVTTSHGRSFFYFDVDDSYLFLASFGVDVDVAVEFFDNAPGQFVIQYDGTDPTAYMGGIYTSSPEAVQMNGGKQWRTATLRLPGVMFGNRQNNRTDFRINVSRDDFYVRSVTVRRAGPVQP